EWTAAYPMAQAEVVEGSDLSRLEPGLAPDLVSCRLAVGYPVGPAAATEAYAAAAARAGADLRVGGGASHLATADARVVGVERDGSVEPAGAVVVAAGPWTPDVVDPTG